MSVPGCYRILILGTTFLVGQALAQDDGLQAYQAARYAEAFELLSPHAGNGHAEAQYVLGLMYAAGQGVEQNFYAAGKMYRLAADQGHAGAQVNLGSLYENCYGNGPCNAEAGAAWYRQAADQGDALGQYNLAVMYATGVGVAQDEWTARTLFRQSAEQGYLPAQYNLAVIYARGMGGPVDRVAAWAWYDLAEQRGYDGAAAGKEKMTARLTDEELERARSLADTLQDAYGAR